MLSNQTVWLYSSRIPAGFPSPAEAFAEKSLNLQDLAVVNPAATYFLEVSGESMIGAGILPGDIVVVDRSLPPQAGDIVVAEVMGEFTLKSLAFEGDRPLLVPANPAYPVLRPTAEQGLCLWGVVRGVYRQLK